MSEQSAIRNLPDLEPVRDGAQAGVSFEELYQELEESVRRLETGDLTLDESLALFERGMLLAEQCNSLLDRAELRVHQLTSRPDGTLEAKPYPT